MTRWGAAPNRGERSRPQRRTASRGHRQADTGSGAVCARRGDPPGAVCASGCTLSIPELPTHRLLGDRLSGRE
jgi:hypothetical protein